MVARSSSIRSNCIFAETSSSVGCHGTARSLAAWNWTRLRRMRTDAPGNGRPCDGHERGAPRKPHPCDEHTRTRRTLSLKCLVPATNAPEKCRRCDRAPCDYDPEAEALVAGAAVSRRPSRRWSQRQPFPGRKLAAPSQGCPFPGSQDARRSQRQALLGRCQ